MKLLKYVEKWPKYLGYGSDTFNTALIFEKQLYYMTQRFGKQPKYLRNGFTMLEMALEFDKRLNYVGNDVCLWEMA